MSVSGALLNKGLRAFAVTDVVTVVQWILVNVFNVRICSLGMCSINLAMFSLLMFFVIILKKNSPSLSIQTKT